MKMEIVFNKKQGIYDVTPIMLQEHMLMWLDSISNGTWVLKLERKQSQRTIDQNKLMWVWMDAIAKEFSEATDKYYSRDCVKEYFCKKYIPLRMPDGEIVGGSTSNMTTEEMSEFLEKVQAHAATEWGITLMNPEDKMFDQWRNQYECN